MMKDVPIVGWDVAFTDEGVFLLEVSSNILITMIDIFPLGESFL